MENGGKMAIEKPYKSCSESELINLKLVFSNTDNLHSIPCLIDGLNEGQRKVLFTCFKRKDKQRVNVSRLGGSVGELSAFYNQVSRCETIVKLAQNYVGSNNINLLQPLGQFGSRLCGGKDSARPQHLYTVMSPLTRLIYHPQDDPLLNYKVEDNQTVEPTWYIPIIPMILVNGKPNYNPCDVITQVRLMIAKQEPQLIHPWYKNYRGTVEYISDNCYLTIGNVAILSDNKIEITELPVGIWTEAYKEDVLMPLLHGSKRVKPLLKDLHEYFTADTVRFVLTFASGEFDRIRSEDGGFHRILKLTSPLNTGQMHAFDDLNFLRRFESTTHILKEYFPIRLEYYLKRKTYLEGELQVQVDRLTEQIRFILEICDSTLVVENRKDIIAELVKRGYRPDPLIEWQCRLQVKIVDEEEESDGTTSSSITEESKEIDAERAFVKTDNRFEYLMGMTISMCQLDKLIEQRDHKLSELTTIKDKTPENLWLQDLDELEKKLNEVEEIERKEELNIGTNNCLPTKNAIKINFKAHICKKCENCR